MKAYISRNDFSKERDTGASEMELYLLHFRFPCLHIWSTLHTFGSSVKVLSIFLKNMSPARAARSSYVICLYLPN